MRILLACHEPPGAGKGLLGPGNLAERLARAGHAVRVWDASATVFDDGPAPRFSDLGGRPGFPQLSAAGVAGYLDSARRRLDELVLRFDPDVIHADYLWLLAYLALESGVPYVASVRGPELLAYQADDRFAACVDQGAENAGRLLLEDASLAKALAVTFPALETPVEVAQPGISWLGGLYQQVREDRCGLLVSRG